MSSSGKKKRSSGLGLAVKLAVSAGLVAFLLSRFDLRSVWAVVAAANRGYLLAGVLAAPLLLPCLAARLELVLSKGRVGIPFCDVLRLTWISQFWNFFLPGSTGGDVYRVARIWQSHPDAKMRVVLAVLFDRFIAAVVLVAFVAAGSLFVPYSRVASVVPGLARLPMLPLSAGAIVLLATGLFVLSRNRAGQAAMGRLLERLRAGRLFLEPDGRLMAALGFGAGGFLLNFLCFFLFCRALGILVTFGQVVLILPAIWLMLMVPVTINGHGLREVLFVFFFSLLKIQTPAGTAESVLALSVVGLASDLLWGLPGALLFVIDRAPGRAPLPPMPAAPGGIRR